jgi:serine/threonine-protein kinase
MSTRRDLHADDSQHGPGSEVRATNGAWRGERDHWVGDVVAGRYCLERFLGEGGMGTVWRARCLVLDVDVAIKILRPEAVGRSADTALNDARSAAAIVHPAIAHILDVGVTEGGELYVVTEHCLEGHSLRDWLDESGRLAPAAAVELALPLASALAELHAQGVVHRDVKATNVLVAPGTARAMAPKLVDFGVALPADAMQTDRHAKHVLLGGLDYMSPEQVEGRADLDARSDQWSFCVLLYELVTGKRPFRADGVRALFFSILASDPQPITALGVGDDALWAILRRGLEKDPRRRFASMNELGRALAAWAVDRGVATDALGAPIARTWLTAPVDDRRGSRTRARVAHGAAALTMLSVLAVGALAVREARHPSHPRATGASRAAGAGTRAATPDDAVCGEAPGLSGVPCTID